MKRKKSTKPKSKKVLVHLLDPLPKDALVTETFTISKFALKENCSSSAINMTIRRVVIDKKQKWGSYKAYNRDSQIVIMRT